VHATAQPPPTTSALAPPSAGTGAASGEIVYEVESSLDPEIAADFDAWLPGHVQAVLASPGFLDVELLRPTEPQPDGRVRRINRYRVRDRASLDHYFEQLAPALRQDGVSRFGDRATHTRRILAAKARLDAPGAHGLCANCDARLVGPYCAECGQHAHESARSVGTLFHDAWHVMTHVDGRFWATLRRLAFSPGHLTNEYFRERRARYIPPFRLYLVLSLVFFGVASLTSAFDTGPVRLDGSPAVSEKDRRELAAARAELARTREEMAQRGTATGAAATTALAALERRVAEAEKRAGGDPRPVDAGSTPEGCDTLKVNPKWLEPTVQHVCARAREDGGRALTKAFVANIPKMMFVFLPLMAAAMLLLYWRPRRYYVEHLVFYLHVHAALFLALAVSMGLAAAVRAATGHDFVSGVGSFAVFVYAVWYVWRAMREHYRNGRLLTLAKFATIFFVYVVCLALTLAGTAVVSALTS
jgi:hypothetical protein